MKRIGLILLIFFAANVCSAQGDKIPWREGTKLKWTDFTGPPDHSSEHDAITRYLFDYNYKWDGGGNITVNINCFFEKNRSWRKIEKKLTPELLVHEQMHFDIAELFARKMRKAFAEYTATHKSGPNTKAEISKIFHDMNTETQKYQDLYDAETDHSRIAEKQLEWNRKLPSMLQELAKYRSN
jgi:hypothetical protein